MCEVLQCTADSEVEFDSSGSWSLVKGVASEPRLPALLWTVLVVTTALFCSVEVEMDVGCKENLLPCQPTVIDLTESDDEDTPSHPITSDPNCLQDWLSADGSTVKPERCVVDLM